MEEHIKQLLEKETQIMNQYKEERRLREKSIEDEKRLQIIRKDIESLIKEENALKSKLDKLKQENFKLESNVNAWQATLNKKLQELKGAELKLEELYKEIWSQRENFCSKADEFNESFGVLSQWWKTQMNILNGVDDWQAMEDEKCKKEIEILQKDVEALKLEVDVVRKQKENSNLNLSADAVSNEQGEKAQLEFAHNETVEIEGNLNDKKLNFSDEEEMIELCTGENPPPNNNLFSIMNINKMRRAKRNPRHKNTIFQKIKKLRNGK